MESNHPSDGNIADKQKASKPSFDVYLKVVALTREGKECIYTKKNKEAIEKFSQAIELHQDPDIFCDRAVAFGILGEYKNAYNDCHTAIELNPKYALPYAVLGMAFKVQFLYNDAIEAYSKALELDPGNGEYIKEISSIKERLNADIQASLPPTPEIIAKANLLKEEGNDFMKALKFNEAIEKYTEANALKRDPVYLCNRAAAFCSLKRYNKAMNDCLDAIILDHKYAKAYGRMAFATSRMGNYEQAIKIYKKALELDPNNKNYKENLALVEAKLGETNEQP